MRTDFIGLSFAEQVAFANRLLAQSDLDEARYRFGALAAARPVQPDGHLGLVKVLMREQRWSDARNVIAPVLDRFLHHYPFAGLSLMACARAYDLDICNRILQSIRATQGELAYHLDLLDMAHILGDDEQVASAASELLKVPVEDHARRDRLIRSLLRSDSRELMNLGIGLLRDEPDGETRFSYAHVRALIRLGRSGEAIARYEAVRSGASDRQGESWAQIEAWYQAARGDIAAARRQYAKTPEKFQPPANLRKPRYSRQGAARQGRCILISVLRNEIEKLPYFLQYYRALGVDGFAFVDNASDDGTRDFLAAQPDVSVFVTDQDFAGHFGMAWLNDIVANHLDADWVLYVDADELLVFPGCEERGVSPVLDYLEDGKFDCMPAVMIDMVPETKQAAKSYRRGAPFGDAAPYFLPAVELLGCANAPYFDAYGGARQDWFGSRLILGKTPIVRGRGAVTFLVSSHYVSPCRVPGTTVFLLHYKFIGPFEQRIDEEVVREQHPTTAFRHKMYKANLGAKPETAPLIDGRYRRYGRSADLADLGVQMQREVFCA